MTYIFVYLISQHEYGISKVDFNFILSNCRHLKNINMHRSIPLDLTMWEQFIWQAKATLLHWHLQRNDKEEKIIVLRVHGQHKKIITLPWPPYLRDYVGCALTSKYRSIFLLPLKKNWHRYLFENIYWTATLCWPEHP